MKTISRILIAALATIITLLPTLGSAHLVSRADPNDTSGPFWDYHEDEQDAESKFPPRALRVTKAVRWRAMSSYMDDSCGDDPTVLDSAPDFPKMNRHPN